MFIQIQSTPNPNTLKFSPEAVVLKANATATFTSIEECNDSPMAKHLMHLDGVKSVFFAHDFISVTKSDDSSWDVLKTIVLTAIMDHYIAGYPIVLESFYHPKQNPSSDDALTDSIVDQIKDIIETKVRPAVAEDGGDILFHKFENGIVYLEMHGACSGCPSSTITLKSGIERMLKHYLPEVISVESINS